MNVSIQLGVMREVLVIKVVKPGLPSGEMVMLYCGSIPFVTSSWRYKGLIWLNVVVYT